MFILSFSVSFICLVVILLRFSASSLFGNQHQLTHPPVKSPTLPFRKMSIFQDVAHRQTNFTTVIPLWDSATAHSPSGKELNPSPQEDARLPGRFASSYNSAVLKQKDVSYILKNFFFWQKV